jgi:hypothetical protein
MVKSKWKKCVLEDVNILSLLIKLKLTNSQLNYNQLIIFMHYYYYSYYDDDDK